MKHIKTSSGFEIELDESRLNDMELVDALADYESGRRIALVTIVNKVMGQDKKRLYDHLRADNGAVPTERVTEEVFEILKISRDGKNF